MTGLSAARRLIAVSAVVATALVGLRGPALAQDGGQGPALRIIRDTETETLLRDYARPILRAAGLGGTTGIEIVIVQDRQFNAFVADGRRIFITTGVLLDSQTPNEVIGVLAHEAGHIAGGHLARLREQLQAAQNSAVVAMLIGVGAMAAGALSRGAGSSDLGGAVGGLAMGAAGMGERTFLAYARTEEQAADRAAVQYLNATGQSPRGMVTTFARMADQMISTARMVDPYAQTHPLPAERLATLRELLAQSPSRDAVDAPALIQRHRLMQAKLIGFTERPDQILRRFPVSDRSLPARYARAIASYRHGGGADAIAAIDALIREQPNNAAFHELRGQALLETGNPRASVASYRRALQLAPQAPLVRAGLGRALVSSEDAAFTDEAIRELERALAQDPNLPLAYRMLATAYGRRGDQGRAQLAIALGHLADGDFRQAQAIARRAQALLPRGSPGWLRADDIVNARPPRRT